MIEVFDLDLKKLAILENAFDRVEEQKLNGVGTFRFKLPSDDPKATYVRPFYFIRNDEGEYYRILQRGAKITDTGALEYQAEHGIATLVDDVMFGTHIIGNVGIYTPDVIRYILDKQTKVRWVLDQCDISKQFEYGFSSENLLNALFSVPNLFVEAYRWAFDMTVRPWKLSLKKIDESAKPQFYVRAEKNLLSSTTDSTNTDLCTRLYLLGYGEGDNQLTIKDINDGKPYIDSPPNVQAKYGVISKVYVDRAFEDAASLMERGKALLAAMQDPPLTRTFGVADLYPLTRDPLDKASVGELVKLTEDGTITYITGVRRNLDKPGDMTLEISTAAADIAASIADIADRQRIEQVYSQGATQIYSQSIQANADTNTQAVLQFFIPEEMRIVNKVAAKITIEAFRSYNKTTSGGGGSARTSGSDGGSTQTSTTGGGGEVTSGPSSRTTVGISDSIYDRGMTVNVTDEPPFPLPRSGANNGNTGTAAGSTGSASESNTGSASGTGVHSHTMLHTHSMNSHSHSLGSHTHELAPHRHNMDHQHSIDHNHLIDHTHTVGVPSHSHKVTIPSHTHSVDIPDHNHGIEQGIFRYGSPTAAKIMINGTEKATMERDRDIDLTPLLLNDSGKITRNSWIKVGILPNDLAYVTIDLYVKGFVQSRGGGTY